MPWDDPFYDDGGWNPGDDLYPPEVTTPEMGNPYLPPGEGGDPDSPPGLGGDAPGSTGDQFDWGSLIGGGADAAQQLLKALGLTNKSGGIDLAGVLSLLALGGGGLNRINSVDRASEQMQEAANKANEMATSTIGGAQGNFAPYISAGQNAVGQMAAFDKTPLAAKFQATGGGKPSALMDQFAAARSLGDVARIRR